jgi:CheY-like chemotaxis protein
MVRFEVRDTGVGIAPDLHDKIFDFYERANLEALSTKQSSGLGLAVSRGIVKLMGGVIGLDSQAGQGSTFWFEIPLQIAQPISHDARSQVTRAIQRRANRARKILIAEDSQASRLLLEVILRKLGHDVVSCENGVEAVAAASCERFDLIILDLHMPVMGGVESVAQMRAMSERVGSKVIIAITADASPEQHKEALEAGMDQVMHKPLDQQMLMSLIDRL